MSNMTILASRHKYCQPAAKKKESKSKTKAVKHSEQRGKDLSKDLSGPADSLAGATDNKS